MSCSEKRESFWEKVNTAQQPAPLDEAKLKAEIESGLMITIGAVKTKIMKELKVLDEEVMAQVGKVIAELEVKVTHKGKIQLREAIEPISEEVKKLQKQIEILRWGLFPGESE